MTTKIKRPQKSLKDAIAESRQKTKGEKTVDKRFTMVKGGSGSDTKTPEPEALKSPITNPTDEQLEVINGFTRTPKTADEIVVFDTWSANNLVDRDFDYFSNDTIKGFASLPQPFSPIGKSFMVGHDYTKMPVGRIFDTDTKTVDDVLWLKNSVYIPNTPQHQNFIENQDFGVYWAVSVGVVLDASLCDICDSHMYRFGFCEEGHIKGLWYDPDSEEVDSFGWPEPVEEGTKGAQQALGRFEGARDFYELSQVFLGAQYFAGLDDKSPELAGIIKGAGAKPVLLGRKEAEALPLPHLPEAVREAKRRFNPTEDADGNLTWKDAQNLVWVYDPDTGDVLSLGKAADDNKEETDAEDQQERQSSDEHGSESDPEPLGDGEDQRSAGSGSADPLHRDPSSAGDPAATEAVEEMTSQRTLAAARKVGVSTDLILRAQERAGDEGSLFESLMSVVVEEVGDLQKQVDELTPKAALGDEYKKSLTAEAIDWYVKANQTNGGPVNIETFQKVLTACGDDLELIKELTTEQRQKAEQRFPGPVRRSSFETDPHERTVVEEDGDDEAEKKPSLAAKWHG